ncbi:MAG: pilus assembly protein, partial [Vitreoscilla sp.]|nr:pilus assembly protein [Polaromonas sp.]
REFKDSKESFDATMAALQGLQLGARPDLWQDYEKAKDKITATAKPVSELKKRFPGRASEIDNALKSSPANAPVGYIPLVGRNTFWTVLINTNTAEVLAFVPLDPF